MNAYLAMIFCSTADLKSYGPEVVDTIRLLAGEKSKRSAGSERIVTIAFVTDRPRTDIRKAFDLLWRPEQKTWVIPLEEPVLVDASIMEWLRRQKT